MLKHASIAFCAGLLLLGATLSVANAQGRNHGDNNGNRNGNSANRGRGDDGGGNHQNQSWHNGKGGNYDKGHQDQSWHRNHNSDEGRPFGNRRYHRHPSYYYHPYRGPEHRRYYTYQGNEFYLNIDTGLRFKL